MKPSQKSEDKLKILRESVGQGIIADFQFQITKGDLKTSVYQRVLGRLHCYIPEGTGKENPSYQLHFFPLLILYYRQFGLDISSAELAAKNAVEEIVTTVANFFGPNYEVIKPSELLERVENEILEDKEDQSQVSRDAKYFGVTMNTLKSIEKV